MLHVKVAQLSVGLQIELSGSKSQSGMYPQYFGPSFKQVSFLQSSSFFKFKKWTELRTKLIIIIIPFSIYLFYEPFLWQGYVWPWFPDMICLANTFIITICVNTICIRTTFSQWTLVDINTWIQWSHWKRNLKNR